VLSCETCHLATDRLTTNGAFEESYHYERMATATGYASAPLSTNPYWLKKDSLNVSYAANPNGLCESCHDHGKNPSTATAVDARNHTAQGMIDNLSYNPKYDTSDNGIWSTFTPKCIDCHDPHGETNWYMLYDAKPEKSDNLDELVYSGPVVYKGDRYGVTRAQSDQYGFPPGPIYANNQAPVTMTGKTNASDFASGTGSGICEVCHSRTQFFRKDGTSPGGAHINSVCTGCHTHKASFAPAGCDGCHGLNGSVSPGKDGVPGTADDAPNVMTVNVSGSWVNVYDGSWWRQVVGGTGSVQQGGHGDPAGLAAVACTECHDTSLPSGAHLDGTVNKVGDPGFSADLAVSVAPANTNTNTAHLKASFINASGGNAGIQINFDAVCAACHLARGVSKHKHYVDSDIPAEVDVRFGTHTTRSNGSLLTPHLPIDIDMSTLAPAGAPHYAPCVACHNPHGSVNTDTKGQPASAASNFMLRYPAFSSKSLCNICHK